MLFLNAIEAEKIETATGVRAEASVSLPDTLIGSEWVKGKVETPHSCCLTLHIFRHGMSV